MPYTLADIAAGETMPVGASLYFDYGTESLDAACEAPHVAIKEWLLEQGYSDGADLKMEKFEGAEHSAASWRARVNEQQEWLLGEDAN